MIGAEFTAADAYPEGHDERRTWIRRVDAAGILGELGAEEPEHVVAGRVDLLGAMPSGCKLSRSTFTGGSSSRSAAPAVRSATVSLASTRSEYLRTLLARTKPPTRASAWIAVTLATDPHMLAEYHATDCLADLLGVKALTVGHAVHETAIDHD